MSYRATHWAWEAELPTLQKFVLVALADMADEEDSCFPGRKRIAAMVGSSVRSVSRALGELEAAGFIIREQRRAADGYRTSDRYWLQVRVEHNVPNRPVVDSQVPTVQTSGANLSNLRGQIGKAIEPPDESPEEPPVALDADWGEVPKGSRVALPFPSPFVLSKADWDWAREKAPSVDVVTVTTEFVAYWREGEGKGTRRKNWPLTWRKRMQAVHARNVEHGWVPASESDRKVIRGGRVVAGA